MKRDGALAERFVAAHCAATFLSLWGVANPIGKDAKKELCDFLVVCDPDVVIISVKDIRLGDKLDKVAADRWQRKAVEKSVKSVYGTERILKSVTEVQSRKGRIITLPPLSKRRYHRICVAFGSKDKLSIPMGDFGKGFVHVLDERSFPILLRELDAIHDFIEYLTAKQSFFESENRAIFLGEENFLAFYIVNGRSIPNRHDTIVIDHTLWDGLRGDKQYRARVEANRASYAWDNTIEYIAKDLLHNNLLHSHPPGQEESVLRIMARESRFNRRCLAESMFEVFTSGKIRARIIRSFSGIVYVFAAFSRDEDRKSRAAELGARCIVARDYYKKDVCTVIGIATERANDGKKGLSFDLILLDVPKWTADWESKAQEARQQFKFFKQPEVSSRHWDEYPKT